MWALPDINRLNADAVTRRTSLEKLAKRPSLGYCGNDHAPRPVRARYSRLIFDIFSDDPKSVELLCERCHETEGFSDDEVFFCSACERDMALNYTWELYRMTDPETGEDTCLACAFKAYRDNPASWIKVADVKTVIMDAKRPLFEDGVLNLAAFPHVLAVKQPHPGVECAETLTVDGYSGGEVMGFSSSADPSRTPTRAASMIADLASQGITEFLPVMDAAWQFARDLSFYRRA